AEILLARVDDDRGGATVLMAVEVIRHRRKVVADDGHLNRTGELVLLPVEDVNRRGAAREPVEVPGEDIVRADPPVSLVAEDRLRVGWLRTISGGRSRTFVKRATGDDHVGLWLRREHDGTGL